MSGRGATGRWRLQLDADRCEGHGICALVCSERVRLDEWGYAAVDQEAIDERLLLRQAERAVGACPEGALRLVPEREVSAVPPSDRRREASGPAAQLSPWSPRSERRAAGGVGEPGGGVA